MFMFSCCPVFSCCCFCFSLSVLNLFPGLESSPSSLPDGSCEVLLGKERGPCPCGDPGPMLLVWPAGDPQAQSLPELQDERSTKPYGQGFCPVGMGLRNPMPCFAWAELTDARLDPSRLLESCWLHHKPPREPPALPQQGFWWGLVGFQHCWDGAETCKTQPSAWKSSLSWDRAAVLPKERHQTSWTVKTKQWHHSMLQVIPVFTGVYTNPPWSFSCILAAALAPWHCP